MLNMHSSDITYAYIYIYIYNLRWRRSLEIANESAG